MPTEDELDAIFSALAHATRRAMLGRLAQGPASVGELGEPHDISAPAISKHLRVLESAGLVRRDLDGRVHRCSLRPAGMQDAAAWMETYRAFWTHQFGKLDVYLEELKSTHMNASTEAPTHGIPDE